MRPYFYPGVWALCLLAACGGDDSHPKADEPAAMAGDSGDTCQRGTPGCACADGDGCSDGSTCNAGTCQVEKSVSYSVSDAAARACEALLTERDNAAVASVRFAAGARGAMVREAPLVGISFIAGPDQTLPASVVKTSLIGGGEPPTVTKLRCFDRVGALLSAVKLTLD